MTINSKIKTLLKDEGIPETEGILYLLSLYHNLDEPMCISQEVMRKVNSLKIVERDYKAKTLTWNLALFEGQNIDDVWSWINDWRNMFKERNPERNGNKSSCVARMKKFFSDNPHIRQEDVIEATEAYLRVTENQYVKKAEKFIMDGRGVMAYSMLKEWCDKVRERRDIQSNDPNIKMM